MKVAERIEEVRQQTKREKKLLAMAMRENQLRALGMKSNALGQVKTENPILEQLVPFASFVAKATVFNRGEFRLSTTPSVAAASWNIFESQL